MKSSKSSQLAEKMRTPAHSTLALPLLLLITATQVIAFSAKFHIKSSYGSFRRTPTQRLHVAILPDLGTTVAKEVIDTSGVAKSSMRFKPLMNEAADFPTAGEVSCCEE